MGGGQCLPGAWGCWGAVLGEAPQKVGERGKGQEGWGWRGWTRSWQPVGSGADKSRLNNQPPGGEASALTESIKEAAGPEQGGRALLGLSGVDQSIDVLIILMMNWIKNSDSGWWERHRRRQKVERLERQQ